MHGSLDICAHINPSSLRTTLALDKTCIVYQIRPLSSTKSNIYRLLFIKDWLTICLCCLSIWVAICPLGRYMNTPLHALAIGVQHNVLHQTQHSGWLLDPVHTRHSTSYCSDHLSKSQTHTQINRPLLGILPVHVCTTLHLPLHLCNMVHIHILMYVPCTLNKVKCRSS